jgi:hypothetical protein
MILLDLPLQGDCVHNMGDGRILKVRKHCLYFQNKSFICVAY